MLKYVYFHRETGRDATLRTVSNLPQGKVLHLQKMTSFSFSKIKKKKIDESILSIINILFYMTKNNFGPLDYKKYQTAEEFYQANLGKIPLTMMQGISEVQKEKNFNFQEAFKFLFEKEKIILIEY